MSFIAEATKRLIGKDEKRISFDNADAVEKIDKNMREELRRFRQELIKTNSKLNNMKAFLKNSEDMLKLQGLSTEAVNKLTALVADTSNKGTQEAILEGQSISNDAALKLVDEYETLTGVMRDLGVQFEASAVTIGDNVSQMITDNRLLESDRKDALGDYTNALINEISGQKDLEDKLQDHLLRLIEISESDQSLTVDLQDEIKTLLDEVTNNVEEIKFRGTIESLADKMDSQVLLNGEVVDLLEQQSSQNGDFKSDFTKNAANFSMGGTSALDLAGGALGLGGLGQGLGDLVGIFKGASGAAKGLTAGLTKFGPLLGKAALVFGAFKVGEKIGEGINFLDEKYLGGKIGEKVQGLFDSVFGFFGGPSSIDDDDAFAMAEEAKKRGISVTDLQKEKEANSIFGKAKSFGSGLLDKAGSAIGFFGSEEQQDKSSAELRAATKEYSKSIREAAVSIKDNPGMLLGGDKTVGEDKTDLLKSNKEQIVVQPPPVNVTVQQPNTPRPSDRSGPVDDLGLSMINQG